MEKSKIQIKSVHGNVLFEFEKENNTFKDTLEEAVKARVTLEGVVLISVSLRNAELIGAYLRKACLINANLRNAKLNYADLSGADLRGADLSGADLRNASLRDAKNIETARVPMYCCWEVNLIGDTIRIGCKEKTIEEWDEWFAGSEEFSTERDTDEFKHIQAMFIAHKAYYEFLNK